LFFRCRLPGYSESAAPGGRLARLRFIEASISDEVDRCADFLYHLIFSLRGVAEPEVGMDGGIDGDSEPIFLGVVAPEETCVSLSESSVMTLSGRDELAV
jgi:hypothetical protein